MGKMTKSDYVELAARGVECIATPEQMMVIRAMAEVIYDTVYNPSLILKVVRSEEAKEFPLICTKKDGDVGYDIPCIIDPDPVFGVREVVLWPHEKVALKSGIKFQIPDGYWIEIKARSSTGNLMVITPDAVIDEKYRGEIYPVLMNVGSEKVVFKHGERYVQVIFHKKCNDNLTVKEVDELDPSERGENGFGSTGR